MSPLVVLPGSIARVLSVAAVRVAGTSAPPAPAAGTSSDPYNIRHTVRHSAEKTNLRLAHFKNQLF